MDKEKATRILAKELTQAKGQTFVTDTAHKKHLLEKAIAYYPITFEKPFSIQFEIDFLNDSSSEISWRRVKEVTNRYQKGLTKHCSNASDANYVFVENSQSVSMAGKYSDYSCLSLMGNLSFFALIGDKEVIDIQKMFYKDLEPNILKAIDTLQIKNFIHLYTNYKRETYFGYHYRPTQRPDDFLEFIFTIPYEDQNMQTNKNILQSHYPYIDLTEILTKEYSSGKFFQEYFNCLKEDSKKEVVDSLRNVKERNTINDSFLWSIGFNDLHLDHIELYKSNASGFIDYFNNRSLEEKKVILKDIMNHDSTNEEVVKWLNENHLDLIREVSLNG